jgi:photosystem II stability/assembly factor-like uncharacterized protein
VLGPDMAVADLIQPDLATVEDLSAPVDLTAPLDLSAPHDLAGVDLTASGDMAGPTFHVEAVPATCGLCGLNSVWESAGGDVYAVGDNGVILHSTPTSHTWTQESTGTTANFYDVWGASGQVFAAGNNAGNPVVLKSTVGSGSWADVSPTGVAVGLNGVFANSSTDVYVAGDSGTILHSTNGSTWSAPLPTMTTNNLRRLWGSGSTVFAVGASKTVIYTTNSGSTWTSPALPSNASDCSDIWGSGTTDIYVASGQYLYHTFNMGGMWVQVTQTTQTLASFLAVWGSSNFDVWTVDNGNRLYHLVGSWSNFFYNGTPNTIVSIRGRAANDFYGVTAVNGSIVHYY